MLLLFVLNSQVNSKEQFNFDVTEIEILENGNIFIGKNRGIINSDSGITITANEFKYNKKLNTINAKGNVKVHDETNDYFLYSDKIVYNKDNEIITTKNNSKAVSKKDNITITANEFKYNKKLNTINAKGNVKVHDETNDYFLYSDKIVYNKDNEIITTKNNSKAVSKKDNITITAQDFDYFIKQNNILAYFNVIVDDKERNYFLTTNYAKYSGIKKHINTKGNSKLNNLNNNSSIVADVFEYDLLKNIIVAKKNVILKNIEKNYEIFSEELTQSKNDKKIISKGKTSAIVKSKYKLKSNDIVFYENTMELSSKSKITIMSENNIYNASNYKYFIDDDFIKGEKIIINSDYKLPENDKFYFESGMLNLENNNFISSDIEINVKKDVFDNNENDPRIKGASSKRVGDITLINKGVFTSCKKNDQCPPWHIQAKKITHDNKKRELFYENAVLKFYNFPVMYFPKFFHPDPTVKRRSGFLKPVINDSNVLGSSLTIPYFNAISEDSDLTVTPTIFDSGSNMFQNEYRKIGENTDVLINFGHTRSYKSSVENKKKNISYIFSKIDFDLDLPEFNTSKINLNIEKVNNDNFLKIFESNLLENTTPLKPKNSDNMKNEIKLTLNHDDYNFVTGFTSYENLQKGKNNRYQYVLPYYDFDKTIIPNSISGSLNFNSNGSNDLNNTNQLTTKVTNNLSYSSEDFLTKSGFKNNFNINLKNLNSVGKNVSEYKSSPDIELSSLFEANSSIPLKKINYNSISYLTPKISTRINPGDMKNHSSNDNTINISNIFSVDRFGLGDSYEAGKSITLGIDYKKETLGEMNKYFEMKLASVFRDQEEKFIPHNTTLDKKSSNLFGSMSTNFLENLELNYNFAVDNNLDEIEYNDINATLTLSNFSTTFNYVKELNEMGDENFIKNSTSYKFNDQNYLKFNTRRNRKINLTEFYDLVYEYKNDCLVAGVKYKKTYYEDKDLKPVENLFLTLTFVPLTTYEQNIDQFK